VIKAMLTLKVAKLQGELDQAGFFSDRSGRHSQKDRADDEPGDQKDSESVGELTRGIGVGSRNTEVGMNNGSVRQPETSKRRES